MSEMTKNTENGRLGGTVTSVSSNGKQAIDKTALSVYDALWSMRWGMTVVDGGWEYVATNPKAEDKAVSVTLMEENPDFFWLMTSAIIIFDVLLVVFLVKRFWEFRSMQKKVMKTQDARILKKGASDWMGRSWKRLSRSSYHRG